MASSSSAANASACAARPKPPKPRAAAAAARLGAVVALARPAQGLAAGHAGGCMYSGAGGPRQRRPR